MLKGFRDFILRGNVVDLAVGIVIGAAFSSIVSALVKDLLTPLIAAIFQQPDFSGLVFTLNGSKFLYGDFINALIAFIIDAAVVYFFVVLPMNKVKDRIQGPVAVTTKACPECAMGDLPLAAKRCPHCTAAIA